MNKEIEKALIEHRIDPIILGIIDKHNNSIDAPYHSKDHMYLVAHNVMLIAANENFDDETVLCALLSALMHDVNHSAGLYDDDVNISNALVATLDIITEYNSTKLSDSDEINNERYQNIVDAIKQTRFPYLSKPQTTTSKLLVDSDLLCMYHCESREQFKKGLEEELGTQITWNSSYHFFNDHIHMISTATGLTMFKNMLHDLSNLTD